MKQRLNDYWMDFWYVLIGAAAAIYLFPGCSSTEDIKLGSKVILDTVTEHGVDVLSKATSGDWIGTLLAIGAAVIGGAGTYFTARKIRQNRKNKQCSEK